MTCARELEIFVAQVLVAPVAAAGRQQRLASQRRIRETLAVRRAAAASGGR